MSRKKNADRRAVVRAAVEAGLAAGDKLARKQGGYCEATYREAVTVAAMHVYDALREEPKA